MFVRIVTAVAVIALCSVCFAQDPATAPALGYQDTFQGNYLWSFGSTGPSLPIIYAVNMGTHIGIPGSTRQVPNGDICVNLYAFNPAGSLLSCCACRVVPNAILMLSYANFTGPGAQTLVIKLLSTLAASTTPVCDAKLPLVTSASPGAPGGFASGMRAWATHVQLVGASGATDAAFSNAPLSAGELNKLIAQCSAAPPLSQCTCGVPAV